MKADSLVFGGGGETKNHLDQTARSAQATAGVSRILIKVTATYIYSLELLFSTTI